MPQSITPDPENTPNSISAAAHAYQLAMQSQQTSTPATSSSATSSVLQMPGATRDVVMEDAPHHRPNNTNPNAANSPIPPRTSTPKPNGTSVSNSTANEQSTSRATSQHPDPGPALPSEASVHGGSARSYLNGKVTGVLLEGMKVLARDQPKDPLRVLGEYLLAKSKELEGNGN
ncbi:COMPASS (complex proteins associated with Set1p) component [Clarireedia jacksonii]